MVRAVSITSKTFQGSQLKEENKPTNPPKSKISYMSLHDKVASTYLDTSENASEQMAGQGTSLIAMCPRAAG